MSTPRFVAFGYENACAAVAAEARAELTEQFAAELEHATYWQRFWLRREIEREVRARVAKCAPPDACY